VPETIKLCVIIFLVVFLVSTATPIQGAPPNLSADLNGDGDVNLEDFAMLAEHWLRCVDPVNPDCEHQWLDGCERCFIAAAAS
jgi:hypothetical protein